MTENSSHSDIALSTQSLDILGGDLGQDPLWPFGRLGSVFSFLDRSRRRSIASPRCQ